MQVTINNWFMENHVIGLHFCLNCGTNSAQGTSVRNHPFLTCGAGQQDGFGNRPLIPLWKGRGNSLGGPQGSASCNGTVCWIRTEARRNQRSKAGAEKRRRREERWSLASTGPEANSDIPRKLLLARLILCPRSAVEDSLVEGFPSGKQSRSAYRIKKAYDRHAVFL